MSDKTAQLPKQFTRRCLLNSWGFWDGAAKSLEWPVSCDRLPYR